MVDPISIKSSRNRFDLNRRELFLFTGERAFFYALFTAAICSHSLRDSNCRWSGMDEAKEHFKKSAGNASNQLEMQPIEERNPSSVAVASGSSSDLGGSPTAASGSSSNLGVAPTAISGSSSNLGVAPTATSGSSSNLGVAPTATSGSSSNLGVAPTAASGSSSNLGRSRVYQRQNAFLSSQPLSRGGDISGQISEAPLSLGLGTAGVGLPPKILSPEAVPSPMTEFVASGSSSNMGRSRVYQRQNAFLPSQPLSRGGDIASEINDAPLSLGRRTAGVGLPPKMLPQEAVPSPMTEFVGAGGGQGIFEQPLRAPVHPLRPPSFDLRPHPHRETQDGTFMRTAACSNTQLWAGQESGVRYWNFSELYSDPVEDKRRTSGGDQETPPFKTSVQTSPTLCLVLDTARSFAWTGHKDGIIRAWKMDGPSDQSPLASFDPRDSFDADMSWPAHRSPVLSLIVTSYGDIWSCSERGIIKVWPSKAIGNILSFPSHKRHLAIAFPYIDLRENVTVGGVKHLLADNARSHVWSGSYLSFALWDSHTKELLKVFGIDGQVDPRADILPANVPYYEDESKDKYAATSRKSQGLMGVFQLSRNVVIGAADAVRSAKSKSVFGEDTRRAEALIISADGMIWMGCANGYLVQWDGNGNRLQNFRLGESPILCLGAFGTRIWAGDANGWMHLLNYDGKLLGSWIAHNSPVIKISVGNGFVFSLANHGGIRGWNLTSPGILDELLLEELTKKQTMYLRRENISVLAGTWNVGQAKACQDSLFKWLCGAASEASLVVIGLQEVEMGLGSIAMAAIKETVGLEGSDNGQWWLDNIGRILEKAGSFERVGSRQLAGLLVAVWAQKSLHTHIGDVDAAAVPCGFGRAVGNKGAVGLRIRIYDRIMCFVNCHFAAHLEEVDRRNADFDHIYRTMTFSRPSQNLDPAKGPSSVVQPSRGPTADDGRPDLADADMLVFLGDFNYRLHGVSYDDAKDLVVQRSFDWLRDRDQLRAQMEQGKVFQGMREGKIKFPPTYKFDKGMPGLSSYDSSEKKRIPAWCDRIIYRDNRSASTSVCSLSCPIVSSVLQYDACMDATDSDHKPVRCILNLDIARVDELAKRQLYGKILSSHYEIASVLRDFHHVPETIMSTNTIILQNQDPAILHIRNISGSRIAFFEISCEWSSMIDDDGDDGRSFGFPHWLEVRPAGGMIAPGQMVEVTVQHKQLPVVGKFVDGGAERSGEEEVKDRAVLLLVHINGEYSREQHTHHVTVR